MVFSTKMQTMMLKHLALSNFSACQALSISQPCTRGTLNRSIYVFEGIQVYSSELKSEGAYLPADALAVVH